MTQPTDENPLTNPGGNLDKFAPNMLTGGDPATIVDNNKGELSDGTDLKALGYGANARKAGS